MSHLIVTFPRGDTAFAAFVRSTIAALDAQAREDPGQVQTALRRWHTRAQVRPQHELARLGATTWYVYRDGHAGRAPRAGLVAGGRRGHGAPG